MSEKRHPIRRIFGFVTKLFLLCCVLLGIFIAVGVAVGWIDFRYHEDQEKMTIEVDTGKVKRNVSNLFGKDDEQESPSDPSTGKQTEDPPATPSTPADGSNAAQPDEPSPAQPDEPSPAQPDEPNPDQPDDAADGTTPEDDPTATDADNESA